MHPWADVVLPEPEHHAGVMAAAGQLWATLDDLARFGAFLLGDTGDVLDPATLEEMAVPAGRGLLGAGLVGVRARPPGAAGGRPDAGRARRLDAGLPRRGLRRPRGADRRGLAGQHHVAGSTPSSSGCWPTCGRPSRGSSSRGRPRRPRWRWTCSASGSGDRRPTCCARWAAACCTSGRCPAAPGRASRFAARDDGTWLGLDGYFAGETLRIADDHLDLGTFVFTRTPYDPEAPVPGGVDERGWR